MQYKSKAEVHVTMDVAPGATSSQHVATDFQLELSRNLHPEGYFTDGLPNKKGSEALTLCFVQALIANIHNAHQNGYRDSAEHLRHIIAELEKGFAAVANAKPSHFNDNF